MKTLNVPYKCTYLTCHRNHCQDLIVDLKNEKEIAKKHNYKLKDEALTVCRSISSSYNILIHVLFKI